MQSGVRNPRWRLTNRNTYISACTQRSCTIIAARYMFPSPWIQWSYSLYCVMQVKFRNPRWWLTKTGYTHFSACTQRSSPIFTIMPMYSCPRFEWRYSLYCAIQAEIRNLKWRPRTGNTYISACIQRSCTIPTTISMFSRAKNSMKLFLHRMMQAKSEIQDGSLDSAFRLHHTW